jgi:predicted nucleic acid-binding Zn ribbon protein
MSEEDRAAIEAFHRVLRSSTSRKPRQQRSGGDLQRLDQALSDVVVDRGWQGPAAGAQALGAWPDIVGLEVAAHVTADRYSEGTLFVRADSTTWAHQIRLLTPQILDRCREVLGSALITHIDVTGPAAPSWVKGPRRVQGRGPRDTYG